MALLTKEQILSAQDLPTQVVEVPEWGGEVKVKTLMGHERDEFEASCIGQGKSKVDLKNMRARLCALAIIDEDGKRMFSDIEVLSLSQKSSKALNRVFDVVRELAGMSDEDVDKLEKGLGAGQSGDSISA